MTSRCPTCGSAYAKSAVKAALGVGADADAPEDEESTAAAKPAGKEDHARTAPKPSFAERMANKYRFARRG